MTVATDAPSLLCFSISEPRVCGWTETSAECMHRYTHIRTQGHTCTRPSQATGPHPAASGSCSLRGLSLRALCSKLLELALLSECKPYFKGTPVLCFCQRSQARLLHIVSLR